MNDLTIDIMINCILVKEGVRPAMLLQPADYGESNGADPKTKQQLEQIKIHYPELHQSENYDTYQGIIISKTSYDGEKNITLDKMGEILGYPCFHRFNEINRDEITYSISVDIIYYFPNPELDIYNKSQLFVNICQNKNKLSEFKKIQKNIETVLHKPTYVELFKSEGIVITDVKITVVPIIPNVLIIQKLIKNVKLNKYEKDELKYNLEYIFG
jgi:hypothetical protein